MDDGKTIASGTTSSSNERLLRHIENSDVDRGDDATSVNTSDLLDMLEQEVNNNKASSSSGGGGGGGDSDNRNGNGGRRRPTARRAPNQSLDSSFTSLLLGGYTDEHHAADDDAVNNNTTTAGTTASAASGSNYGSDKSGQPTSSASAAISSSSSPTKSHRSTNTNNSSNSPYQSDASAGKSKHSSGLVSRPSFDNPFRSNNSLNRMVNNNNNNNNNSHSTTANNNVSGNNGVKHNISRIGGGSFSSDRAGDNDNVSGSDSLANTSSASGVSLRSQQQQQQQQRKTQKGVSFSIQEGTDTKGEDTSSHVGSQMNATKSTHSSDTFSLGSLAFSVSTRSSYTSRSSKSSRSSHGSATTASTHSSHSTQERRKRRELLPVKQERSKKGSRGGGGSSSAGNSSFSGRGSSAGNSSFSGSSGAFSGNSGKFGGVHHHHRRRSKRSSSAGDASTGSGSASSRNLYNNNRRSKSSGSAGSNSNSNNNNEEGAHHGNLHDHHPIRYPKRSGLYGHIEEGNENDGDDEEERETEEDVPVSHILNDSNHSGRGADTDEDGLFRRVSKVRNEIMAMDSEQSKNDFLDGLIASTTKTPLKTNNSSNINNNNKGSNQNNDAMSAGETSFLSALLTTNNAAARQRKGGSVISTAQTADGNTTRNSEASTLTDNTDESSTNINIYKNKSSRSRMSDDSSIMTMLRKMNVFQKMERYYDEGGEILPTSRKEWAMFAVCALLLSPLIHVGVIYLMGDKTGTKSYYGNDIRYTSNAAARGGNGRLKRKVVGGGVITSSPLHSNAWAGSSQVMLSKSSSLRENFILIPDADWIELQISRSKASAMKSSSKSDSSFFFRKQDSTSESPPKPPQRLPLPSVIDPIKNSSFGGRSTNIVLYSLTASNGNNLPDNKQLYTSNQSKLNVNANMNLWTAINDRLVPRPKDVWPCWSHNSLAQYREDGYTLLYPYGMKKEARLALIKLAREFGQELIYEFVTWSEDFPGGIRGSGGGVEELRAGSVRRVGKDGSAIVIPALPNGRSDVMIRRTISTSSSASSSVSAMKEWEEAQEPAVVMRRVKDLPVEDELTMREWEGPSLEEILWKK